MPDASAPGAVAGEGEADDWKTCERCGLTGVPGLGVMVVATEALPTDAAGVTVEQRESSTVLRRGVGRA
jgi:hypothetical protein